MKGSGQSSTSLRQGFYKHEHDNSIFNDDESESQNSGALQGVSLVGSQDNGLRKDSCLTAEPMKEDIVTGLSLGRQSPKSPAFYPLDQLDWEIGIVWDNSPAVSDNSVKSCEITGPHFEASVDSETESETGLQNSLVEPEVEADKKTHQNLVRSYPVILEQFGTRTPSGPSSLPFSEGRYHPQLLRLESRSEVDDSNQVDDGMEKVVEKQLHRTDASTHFSKLITQNKDMLEGSWLDRIIWEQEKPVRKPKLIFDLQDEQMLFEILDSKDGKNLRLHAGAMIITRSVNSNYGDSLELSGHGGQSGWRSVANDKHYSNRKTSQQMKSNSKKRTAQGIKIYHSQPALTLQTMKLKLSK